MLYGDFDLRRGDSDAARRWGGTTRSVASAQATGGAPTAVGSGSAVADLQRDLASLGFLYVKGASSGEFDDFTEGAVRELQCYAKMDVVAREDPTRQGAYVERLSAVPSGAAKYAGHVSGVVNAGTRRVIEHWLKERWRCPVVLDAWSTGRSPARQQENVWHYNEVSGGLVVKARDFTGYYREQKPDELWSVAKSLRYEGSRGPAGAIELGWSEVEVLPELVFGRDFDSVDSANQSTFRVVRCVSEIECMGFFDIINAYDRAVVSTGLVHWTFLDGSGELSTMLARFADSAPADYARAFVSFGLDVRTRGASSRVDPPAVKLEDEDGRYQRIVEHPNPKNQQERDLKAAELARINYVRNWHWCYRFVMAARTISSYRQEMWKMVMARIHLIRGTEWRELTEITITAADGSRSRRRAIVADAITSELGMGIILRWHVLSPAGIVENGRVGRALRAALDDAKAANSGLKWNDSPDTWGQAEEDALIKALQDRADSGSREMRDSIPKVARFPRTTAREWKLDRAHIGALSSRRDSFDFTSIPGYGYFFADDPMASGQLAGADTQVKPGPARTQIISKR